MRSGRETTPSTAGGIEFGFPGTTTTALQMGQATFFPAFSSRTNIAWPAGHAKVVGAVLGCAGCGSLASGFTRRRRFRGRCDLVAEPQSGNPITPAAIKHTTALIAWATSQRPSKFAP